MAKRLVTTASLLILSVAFAVASFSTTANALGGAGGLVGGRTKVPNVKTNKEVQDLGRYSVEEYNRVRRSRNRGGGGDLKFSEVVAAEKQIVSGIKYFLRVTAFAASSGVPKTFDAVVVVKPWVHSKQLLNFAPSPATK